MKVEHLWTQQAAKAFFGTTTTYTTVLTTTTACYTSANALSSACSRRRRSLIDTSPIEGSLKHPLIAPVSTYDEYIEEEPTVIGHSVSTNRRNDKSMNLSKLDELNQIANVRTAEEKVEPRFFLFYWYTSTITTTATSYTKTTTFTIAGCTPAGSFSYAVCG